MSIAFAPDQARDALKEYDGQIVEVAYDLEPFGMAGAPTIERKGKVMCLKIQTVEYDKPQYEWYPPSKVKQTKWVSLLEALQEVGALKEVNTAGANDDERMANFCNSLLGMKFHWEEKEFTSLVKEKGGAPKRFSLLVPTQYYGRLPIVKTEVKQATIGEELK